MNMRKLLEAISKFAGTPEQKPGDQVRGTDKANTGGKEHPFKGRLVGDSVEPQANMLGELSREAQDKSVEWSLAEEYTQFLEDNIGVEPQRPARKGSRPRRDMSKTDKPSKRYTPIKESAGDGDGDVANAVVAEVIKLIGEGHTEVSPDVITTKVSAALGHPFMLKDLVAANNSSPELQHYIDSINPSKIKFSTDILTVKNEDPMKEKKAAQDGVANMASRAASRPRLGESLAEGVTSPEIKQAYNDIFKTEPQTPERKQAVEHYQQLRKEAMANSTKGVKEEMNENAEELNVGDEVIITGPVEFKGVTGIIAGFGRNNRFVVVDIPGEGRHSFHSSDVSAHDGDELDEGDWNLHEGASKEQRKSNRELWDRVNSKGVVAPIDRERYTDLSYQGLEGPFRTKRGGVLYYDPKEGKYYDRDRDMYVDHGLDESKDTSGDVTVSYTDRNHKTVTKTFKNDQQGAPENAMKKARAYAAKLEKDKGDNIRGKVKVEWVKQVDEAALGELSPDTLNAYTRKAKEDQAITTADYFDRKVSRNDALSTIVKRDRGIDRAQSKLTHEGKRGTFTAGSKSYYKAGQTAIKNMRAAAKEREEREKKDSEQKEKSTTADTNEGRMALPPGWKNKGWNPSLKSNKPNWPKEVPSDREVERNMNRSEEENDPHPYNNPPVKEEDDNTNLNVGVEAYGVFGMKSRPWRKKFKSQQAFERWLDANEGNVEVHGTREYNLDDTFNESRADRVGSWVVHKDGKLVKRFKTNLGAKKYAEKNGGTVASAEYFADKFSSKEVNETTLTELNTRYDQVKYKGKLLTLDRWSDGTLTISAGDKVLKSGAFEEIKAVWDKLKGEVGIELGEGWESGPEERAPRERDPDAEYDARRQEKADAAANAEPKKVTYKLNGRGPNGEANYDFGLGEFGSQEEAVAARSRLMANPKTPNPRDISIQTIRRSVSESRISNIKKQYDELKEMLEKVKSTKKKKVNESVDDLLTSFRNGWRKIEGSDFYGPGYKKHIQSYYGLMRKALMANDVDYFWRCYEEFGSLYPDEFVDFLDECELGSIEDIESQLALDNDLAEARVEDLKMVTPDDFVIIVNGDTATIASKEPRGQGVTAINRAAYAARKTPGVTATRTQAGRDLNDPKNMLKFTAPKFTITTSGNAEQIANSIVANAIKTVNSELSQRQASKAAAPERAKAASKFSAQRKKSNDAEIAAKLGLTPADMKRVTYRQVGGDDGYQYNVFIDGRSIVNGLTLAEVPYYKMRAYEIIAKRKGNAVAEGVENPHDVINRKLQDIDSRQTPAEPEDLTARAARAKAEYAKYVAKMKAKNPNYIPMYKMDEDIPTGQTTMAAKTGANDPAQAAKVAQATQALKSATGAPAPVTNIAKALNAATQGTTVNATDMKAIEPMMDVLGTAAQDPKLANQFKTLATQAKQSQQQQQQK